MKCTYHSHKDAATKCSQCLKPLCDECAASGKDEKVVCSRCAVLVAAQDASLGIDERGEEREEKRQAKAKGKRTSRVLMLVVISLAAAVLAANLYFYLKAKVPDAKEFDPYKDLLLTAYLINDAIIDYSNDHGGKFPEKLDDIPGKYIPSEKITSSVLKKFSYTRSSPNSYKLRVKDSVGGADSELVFTEGDL